MIDQAKQKIELRNRIAPRHKRWVGRSSLVSCSGVPSLTLTSSPNNQQRQMKEGQCNGSERREKLTLPS